MKFRDYITNDFETEEQHYITSLRSRYYRCHKDKAIEAVKTLINDVKAYVKYADQERGEIIFENNQFSVTATIVSPSFSETSIDFKITTYSLLPLGKGKKYIEDFYKRLDNIIPFKGTGLYHGR